MTQSTPMPEENNVYLPVIGGGVQGQPPPTATPAPTPAPAQKVAIDPITRIEGHLRIEVQVENGQVTDAWGAGMMFRGIELVLQGRDPRDAWVYAQRICGV